MCTTHLQKWGLFTYKRRGGQDGQESPAEPQRKRKNRLLQRKRESLPRFTSRPIRPITPSPATTNLVHPNVYRPHELALHLVGHLVYAVFGDSRSHLTHRDLLYPKPEQPNEVEWLGIPDLYYTAEGYFRAEKMKKFTNKIAEARLNLRSPVFNLALCTGNVPIDLKRGQYLVMISRFWRICHKLLQKDSIWDRYDYSFVSDFLLEFAKLVSEASCKTPRRTYVKGSKTACRKLVGPCEQPERCGKQHPLYKLLFTLAQFSKADMKSMLRLCAARTVETLAPGLVHAKRRLVLRHWTCYMYFD